jgi:hypothetical protein
MILLLDCLGMLMYPCASWLDRSETACVQLLLLLLLMLRSVL